MPDDEHFQQNEPATDASPTQRDPDTSEPSTDRPFPPKTDAEVAADGGNGQDQDVEFERFILKQGFVAEEEIEHCRSQQEGLIKEGKSRSLVDLLVEHKYLTVTQKARLLHELENRVVKQQIPGYQLLSKLGRGSMATVYKARQMSLDRIVALKVLTHTQSENPEFVDRFYQEGKAAAKLNHPNIVRAIDVGEADGYHYFVMEFVDGHTVHDVLAQNRRYSEQEALKIIIQIAEALAHAHKCGLVHRDVKPKNIMINTAGEAKLADMGLAREVSDTRMAESEKGKAFGTPYYIAPEQVRGEVNIDFRADIYSLGGTFYHMVTGKVPFDGPSPTTVMLKHLREQLIPPDHINPELSTDCAEVIEVMMAKEPQSRYRSTDDVLDDLRALQKRRPPIHARATFDMDELASLSEQGGAVQPAVKTSSPSPKGDVWKIVAFILALLLLFSAIVNIGLLLF